MNSLINTYYILNKEDELDKKKILNLLDSHYSTGDSLFYLKEVNESVEEKLTATFLSLQIIKKTGLEFEKIDDVKNKLIALLQSEENLFNNDVNIFLNKTSVLISSLSMFEMNSEDIHIDKNMNKKIYNWLEYWNNNALKIERPSVISMLYFRNLLKVNEFFNYESEAVKSALSNFLDESILYDTDSYIIEPQYIYLIIDLTEKVDIVLPHSTYNKRINNYIKNSFDTDFVRISNPHLDVIDIYYGILMAKEVNFDFDKKKIKKTLRNAYLEIINKKLSSRESTDLYYIIECFRELSSEVELNDDFLSGYEEYIINQIKTNSEEVELLKEIKKFLSILEYTKRDLNQSTKELIVKGLTRISKNEDIYDTIECINIYLIYKQIKENPPPWIIEKIDSSLVLLKSDGGYKFAMRTDISSSDVLSTYLVTDYLYERKKLTTEIRKDVELFLQKNKEDQSDNPPDLRFIYQRHRLLKIAENK